MQQRGTQQLRRRHCHGVWLQAPMLLPIGEGGGEGGGDVAACGAAQSASRSPASQQQQLARVRDCAAKRRATENRHGLSDTVAVSVIREREPPQMQR